MKKICILFLVFALAGCGLIVREDQDIKAIGIKDRDAQETVEFVDKKAEDEKTRIWPWGKISEDVE